jgi:hypothetical protein
MEAGGRRLGSEGELSVGLSWPALIDIVGSGLATNAHSAGIERFAPSNGRSGSHSALSTSWPAAMPAIHVLASSSKQDVDGRDKHGHDVESAEHDRDTRLVRREWFNPRNVP